MNIEDDMNQKNLKMKELIVNIQMMMFHMMKEIMKEEEKDIEELIELILVDLKVEIGA